MIRFFYYTVMFVGMHIKDANDTLLPLNLVSETTNNIKIQIEASTMMRINMIIKKIKRTIEKCKVIFFSLNNTFI